MKRRAYDNTRRAEQAAQANERILDAAARAFASLPFEEVSLGSIAREADLTVQTVLRKFGSKVELFEAMARREGERILDRRAADPGGGTEAALDALIDHYEHDGDFVHHLVRQEDRTPVIKTMVDAGRKEHRVWAERLLALTGADDPGHRDACEEEVAAVIAATDLSTWRLLRGDLGLDRAVARRVVARLVAGATRNEDPR